MENLENVPAIINQRMGQPIRVGWGRKEINSFSRVHIDNKIVDIKILCLMDAIPECPKLSHEDRGGACHDPINGTWIQMHD